MATPRMPEVLYDARGSRGCCSMSRGQSEYRKIDLCGTDGFFPLRSDAYVTKKPGSRRTCSRHHFELLRGGYLTPVPFCLAG